MAVKTRFVYTDGATPIDVSVPLDATATVEASLGIDEPATVANDSAAHGFTLAVPFSPLKMMFIVSDQDITLKTNSSSSPAQTFTLKANVPFVWVTGMPTTNPITTNITALYWVCAAAENAVVKAVFRYAG